MSLKSADTLRARVTHIWPVLLAWSARHWKWLTFLIWIAIAVAMVVSRWPAIHWLVLGDTDDNIRYVQVKDWLAGQGWYDLRQYRLDPPGGANIHWSRLVDIPIAGLILFFRAFVDQGLADRLACGIAPLLPLLLLGWGVGRAVKLEASAGRAIGFSAATRAVRPSRSSPGLSSAMSAATTRPDANTWSISRSTCASGTPSGAGAETPGACPPGSTSRHTVRYTASLRARSIASACCASRRPAASCRLSSSQ